MAYYTQNKELESAESKLEQGLDLHDLVLGALTIISVFIPVRSTAQNMTATPKGKSPASRKGLPEKITPLSQNNVQDDATIIFSVILLALSAITIAILGIKVFFTFYLDGVDSVTTDVMVATQAIFVQIFFAVLTTMVGVGFTMYGIRKKTKVLPLVLSIYTSVVLFIVMIGFGKLAFDVFIADIKFAEPNNMFLMSLRIFVAGIAFLPGLGLSHFIIHTLNDELLPHTTKAYTWFCIVLTTLSYLRIVYNITINMVPESRSIVYILTILAGLMAVVGLHSVQKKHTWRVFAFPFMVLLTFQACLIVVHYFFLEEQVGRWWPDTFFLIGTVSIIIGFTSASRKSK